MKIIVRGCLIDQMKRRDALITIKEYFISLQYIVAEKNQENPKEYHFSKTILFLVYTAYCIV